jgi:hypothetical protein
VLSHAAAGAALSGHCSQSSTRQSFTASLPVSTQPAPHPFLALLPWPPVPYCRHSSSIAFHLLGLKCGACGSYNTRRMGLHTSDGSPMLNAGRLGRPDAAPGPAVAAAAAAGVAVGGALVPDLLQALFGPPPPGHAGDEEEWEEAVSCAALVAAVCAFNDAVAACKRCLLWGATAGLWLAARP